MVTRPVAIAVICVGFFLILQALVPKAVALKGPSNFHRYLMEGHRNHKKKNYIEQAKDKELGSMDNGVSYEIEPFDPNRNPEELSAFIVDYANMIRNHVILLDKSVETRTRKRGNIKVKKYNNQVIPDPPCKCDHEVKNLTLEEDVFPRIIETRNCKEVNNYSCRPPYRCQDDVYNITLLRKRSHGSEPMYENDIPLHSNLKLQWYPDLISISVGCTCSSAYITKN